MSRRAQSRRKRVFIDIPLAWLPSDFAPCARAEIVDVAPHLANVATFAVHRHKSGRGWRVSNVETGGYIDVGVQLTRDDAIDVATANLATWTPARIAEQMASANRKWWSDKP